MQAPANSMSRDADLSGAEFGDYVAARCENAAAQAEATANDGSHSAGLYLLRNSLYRAC
jgi:hypothetical protein